MQETGNNIIQRNERLTVRIGQNSLCFAYDREGKGDFVFVPYKAKNGISMAANLREALKDETLNIGKWRKVKVLIDSPVIMVPIDEYSDQNKEQLYNYTITGKENSAVLATILPSVSAVALYALNKDLRLVLTDNFQDIKIHPVCASMWQHLQHRSLSGTAQKLYCYFHDGKMDVCSFMKNHPPERRDVFPALRMEAARHGREEGRGVSDGRLPGIRHADGEPEAVSGKRVQDKAVGRLQPPSAHKDRRRAV